MTDPFWLAANPLPTHAVVGVSLFAVWAIAEGAIHLLGVFQTGRTDRQRAGLTGLQTAFFCCVAYGGFDAVVARWTTAGEAWWPLFYLGAVVVAVGLLIRITARLQIGTNFSAFVQTSDSHRLVTEGVYSRVRHPAYTGFLGFLIGFPLCFGSAGALVLALAIGLPAIRRRIQLEEDAMTGWFGDAYRDYQRRTARLIPGLW